MQENVLGMSEGYQLSAISHQVLLRSYLINGFGKGTASAVPLKTNKDAGFSP
jgi:hypothetical protein